MCGCIIANRYDGRCADDVEEKGIHTRPVQEGLKTVRCEEVFHDTYNRDPDGLRILSIQDQSSWCAQLIINTEDKWGWRWTRVSIFVQPKAQWSGGAEEPELPQAGTKVPCGQYSR
jgi:hypothetical protein